MNLHCAPWTSRNQYATAGRCSFHPQRKFKAILLGIALCWFSFPISAAEPYMRELLFSTKPNIVFGFENDLFFGSDNNYTNAVRLSVSNTSLTDSGDVKIYKDAKGRQYKLTGTAHIANNIYTGSDIKLFPEEIPPDDLPYAGWSYIGIGKQRVYEDDSMRRWEFDVGCIGPCAGSRNIQTFIHDVFNHTEPQGWDTQIGNDAAIQFFYDRRRPAKKVKAEQLTPIDPESIRLDFSLSTHAELGTIFNSIGVGATLRRRIVHMKSYYDGIGLPSSMPKLLPPKASYESFFYLRARAKLVAYNATIEGGMFHDNSPFTQDIRHGILDLELGVSIEFKKCVITAYAASRSTEIELQPSDPFNHKWGGINIVFKR